MNVVGVDDTSNRQLADALPHQLNLGALQSAKKIGSHVNPVRRPALPSGYSVFSNIMTLSHNDNLTESGISPAQPDWSDDSLQKITEELEGIRIGRGLTINY